MNLDKEEHGHSFGQERPRASEWRTWIVIGLTATTMAVEILAGIAYGSMAFLADGLHMASHTVALAIAALAYRYALKHAFDQRFSFGTGKVNSLGGLHRSRTHLSLGKDPPETRNVEPPEGGEIRALLQGGGLHPRCARTAA